jgi:GNAT superfamily N-acetyltransferase
VRITSPYDIRRAGLEDRPALIQTITTAFDPIAVSRWLCPDPVQRPIVLGGYLDLITEHAQRHGTVEYLPAYAGVAVWLSEPSPPIPDYTQNLTEITGRWAERFHALDAAMDAAHPVDRPHSYLVFLAVRPTLQSRGLGSRLLQHHLSELDRTGTPSYLEAADERSRALYTQHGYVDCAPPLDLPVRQSLLPMWRKPVRAPAGRSLLMSG